MQGCTLSKDASTIHLQAFAKSLQEAITMKWGYADMAAISL